ncbi:uncharacterized protein BDZ99DRAFT_352758, partial [Mytilinidion resinicola]
WSDALCIVQNDIQDWAEQSAAMSTIYSGALLSISACSAISNESGFLQLREQHLILELQVPCPDHGKDCTLQFRRQSNVDIIQKHDGKKWPLDRRGWTLQEMLLPRRQIRIDVEQITWVCRSIVSLESYDREAPFIGVARGANDIFKALSFQSRANGTTTPSNPTTEAGERDRALRRWAVIVAEFSGRDLTYAADKLPALSGLASSFNNILGDQYLAGLWQSDLHRSLLWFRDTFHTGKLSRPSEYRAPSFTWASVDGY